MTHVFDGAHLGNAYHILACAYDRWAPSLCGRSGMLLNRGWTEGIPVEGDRVCKTCTRVKETLERGEKN